VANTISGAGTIDGVALIFHNEAKGIIDAAFSDNALNIQNFSNFKNEGAIEAHGKLVITDSFINDDASTAAIKTLSAGAVIDLDHTTVSGSGTISTVANSTIEAIGSSASSITAKSIINAGTVEAHGNDLTVAGAVTNTGTLSAIDHHHLTITGAVTGNGAASLDSGGTLEFDAASSAKITFHDNASTLVLASATTTAAKFTGTISGFAGGDVIELGAFHDAAHTTPSVSFINTSGGFVTLTDTNTHASLKLNFVGDYTHQDFEVHQDASHPTHIDLVLH
jgi:hypothetical protein